MSPEEVEADVIQNARAYLAGARTAQVALMGARGLSAAPSMREPVRMLNTAIERAALHNENGDTEMDFRWSMVADALLSLATQSAVVWTQMKTGTGGA